MQYFATGMCMCAHFCYKMVFCGIFVWCIMGFVRWVYCIFCCWFQGPVIVGIPRMISACILLSAWWHHGNNFWVAGPLWGESTGHRLIPLTKVRTVSYYSDMILSQVFQPMGAQLSLKAALPLAERLVTASNSCSKIGPCDSDLWCFLWSVPEQTIEQTIETLVIWDAIMLIMTSQLCAFYPRPVLAFGYCRCLRLCVCLSVCVSITCLSAR